MKGHSCSHIYFLLQVMISVVLRNLEYGISDYFPLWGETSPSGGGTGSSTDWVSGQQMKQLIRQQMRLLLLLKLGYLVAFVVVSTFSPTLPLPFIYWRQFRCRCCYSTTTLMTVVMEPVDLAGFPLAPLVGSLDGYRYCWQLSAHTHTHTQLLFELLTHPFHGVLLPLLALHFHACFVVLSELNCLLFNNIVLYDYVSKCLSLVCSLCTYVSFYLFITVLHTVLKWHGNAHTHSHTQRETYILLGAWLMAAYVACKCQLQILIVGHADKGLPTAIVVPHICVVCAVCWLDLG